MRLAQVRSRLGSALRWLVPSAVAACTGALVGGLVEGVRGDGLAGALAAAGLVAMLAVPALVVASAVVRGALAAWRPDELARRLVDADGAAPRLAGWVAVVWLGALGLAVAMFHGIWLLSIYTAFKPLTLSFLVPALAVGVALTLVAASRPCARLFGWLALRIDMRWRRGGRRTLLRPRIILVAASLAALAAIYAVWRLAIRPRLGPLDTSLLHVPAAALAASGVTHAAWTRLGRATSRARVLLSAGTAAATGAAIATALIVVVTRPSLTLELWGDCPLAGLSIETVFDIEAVRDRIAPSAFRPPARPGASHPDILLITIDTVRADHTPPYGGQADMPTLRELAARGTVFDWAFAPGNVTRRSIPSIAVGLSPTHVRGRVVGWALRLDPRHVVLAERLRAAGYDTAGFMCCEGFWGKTFNTGLERGLEHVEIDHRGHDLAAKARAWLEAREQRTNKPPLFLWMHLIEPHNWTQPTGEPRNDSERRAFYDRSLTAADQMVGDVLGALHRSPGDMPVVIVTADHGEALGEHGQPFHSTDLYNSQIRVPLVIAGPTIQPQHIAETVSLTDLVPTILDLAGFVPPAAPALDGRSLADLAAGARTADPDAGIAFAAMIKDRSNPGGIAAIVKGRWKLIDTSDTLELYDVRADPDEHNNVLSHQPRLRDELRKLLAERAAAASPFD